MSKMNSYFVKNKLQIVLQKVQLVPTTFNCRTCVIKKSYIYKIAIVYCNNDLDKQLYPVPINELFRVVVIYAENFDVELVKKGAKLFEGFHDFRSFMANPANRNSKKITKRIISRSEFQQGKTLNTFDNHFPQNLRVEYWDFFFESKGFLYKQVRKFVSSLIGLGKGTIDLNDLKSLLEIPNDKSWPTHLHIAPPHGLYLNNVEYSPEDLKLE